MFFEYIFYKGDIGSCYLLIKDIFYFESVVFYILEDDFIFSNIYLVLIGFIY